MADNAHESERALSARDRSRSPPVRPWKEAADATSAAEPQEASAAAALDFLDALERDDAAVISLATSRSAASGRPEAVAEELERLLLGPPPSALAVLGGEGGASVRPERDGDWAERALGALKTVSCHDVPRRLTSLRLDALPLVGGGALDPLSSLDSLRSLRVEGCVALPTSALRALRSLHRLELVSLRGCASVGDQATGFLLPMPRLRSLHLDGTAVGDVALLAASVLCPLAHLLRPSRQPVPPAAAPPPTSHERASPLARPPPRPVCPPPPPHPPPPTHPPPSHAPLSLAPPLRCFRSWCGCM